MSINIQKEVHWNLVSILGVSLGGRFFCVLRFLVDWHAIVDKAANRAGYVLVQVEPKKWLTITFVPAGTKV